MLDVIGAGEIEADNVEAELGQAEAENMLVVMPREALVDEVGSSRRNEQACSSTGEREVRGGRGFSYERWHLIDLSSPRSLFSVLAISNSAASKADMIRLY